MADLRGQRKMEWTFDINTDSWVTGDPKNGAGIYKFTEDKYYFNLVIDNILVSFYEGPFDTFAEAQRAIEQATRNYNASK